MTTEFLGKYEESSEKPLHKYYLKLECDDDGEGYVFIVDECGTKLTMLLNIRAHFSHGERYVRLPASQDLEQFGFKTDAAGKVFVT